MSPAPKVRRMSWLPMVDRACCCCSLEAFNKVLGFLAVIGSFVCIVSLTAVWVNLNCHSRRQDMASECQPIPILSGMLYFLNFGILEFVTAFLFLFGVYQSKPGMMTPFIVQQHICVIVLIHTWMMAAGHPNIPGIVSLLVVVPPLALQIYFLVCANSLRVKMEYSQNGISQELMNDIE